jgi:hypothetical protein
MMTMAIKRRYGYRKQDAATKVCKLALTIKCRMEQAESALALSVELVVKNIDEL